MGAQGSGDPQFELRVEAVGGWTVVAVGGDLDVVSAPELRSAMSDLIAGGQTRLAVDLRPTEFIDSSGLSALVTGLKQAAAADGELVLVCPPGNVRRLVEVLALDQVFRIYDSVPSAAPP